MEDKKLWLYTIGKSNGVTLTADQLGLFERYSKLLLEWNKKVNLVSRRDEENLWQRHLLHSLSVLFKLVFEPTASILDLGTGGGLPGIPLKIAFPQIHMTLLDSTRKKIEAVNDIIISLSLQNVEAVWGRAEELGREPGLCAKFDFVVARAVAPLQELVEWSMPFLKLQDQSAVEEESTVRSTARKNVRAPALIAFKGGEIEKEIHRARLLKKVKKIDVIDLVFNGSEELSASEKKLIVVKF